MVASKSMNKYRTITIEVEARVYEPNTLFFRQEIASTTAPDGHEYEMSIGMNNGAVLVWGGPDTEWLAIRPSALINAYRAALEAPDGE